MDKNPVPQIFKKMADILSEVEAISKDQKNNEQNYKFRGIDDVYNALNPLFKKHRIFCTSKVLSEKRESGVSKKGSAFTTSILEIEFNYWAEDGSTVSSVMKGEAMDYGDKATNKAMSAAQKYALIQMFLIPTQDGAPDSDKTVVKVDENELELLKIEVLKFTSHSRLTKWANDLDEWHGSKEFLDAVRKQLSTLNPLS